MPVGAMIIWRAERPGRRKLQAVIGGLVLSLVLVCPVTAQTADPDRPLEGEAYTSAEAAYKAFEQGNYQAAANQAATSVNLRPDILRLRLLLIDSTIAAGNLAAAEQATAAALSTFSANQELQSRQSSIRQRLAQQPAGEGYKALERGDTKAAIRAARRAVEYGPDVMSYRLLLLAAQLADNSLSAAAETAAEAIRLDPGNYVPVVWRAYIYQRLGNRTLAVADLNAALALPDLTDAEKKQIRLIAADAALASGDYRAVQTLLQPYPKTDPLVVTRIGDADAVAEGKATLKGDGKLLPMPVQDCRDTPYGSVCSLQAPYVQSIATPIDRKAEGIEAAGRAYEASRARNYGVAIEEARKAVAGMPEIASTRLLLINLLLSAGRSAEAEATASRAIAEGLATAEIYAQRGFARVRIGKDRGAMADWETSLARGLPVEQVRNVRLALVDTALKAREPQRAIRAIPRTRLDYEFTIRRAYANQSLGHKEEALRDFKSAERLSTSNTQRDAAIQAEINTLLELGRKPEAGAIFDAAIARGQLASIREADVAYIGVAVANDKVALELFDRAKAKGALPPRATIDAGYTAMRRFQNPKAVAYLKEGIEAKADGRINIDDQKLFETRRTVADLTRTWGINSSISYGKVGSAPNPFLTINSPGSSYTSQFGSELYYRPEAFGNRNGALFEVFGRVFETLYDQAGGPTGLPTTQGMAGARWKPFSEHNLVLEVDRLFRLGDAARNDTLLRGAYSYSVGTDLRAIDTHWPTWYIYTEVDRFFEKTQLVGLFEGRFGHSFRLDPVSRNLVLFPHAVIAASYDDSFAVHDAYSAGVGGSIRYWFGETKYVAPPSYWELTLQYRFRLAGDKRAEGIFAQTSINY